MEILNNIILFKVIAICFSLMLLAQAYIIRVTTGTYLLPSSLFSFAWFLFTFLPMILLFNVPINPLSILYVFVAIFVFSLSATPFNWSKALKKNRIKHVTILPNLNTVLIRYCLYFSIISSFVFSLLLVLSNGFDFASFKNDFIGTSARYAALRGNEYLEYGVIGTLSIFFTYFSALLTGIVTFYKKSGVRKLFSFLIGVVPSLFTMLIQSSKLIFFVAVIFYISTTLLMRIYSNQNYLFRVSDYKRIGILSLIILPLLIFAFVSREGYNNFNNSSEAVSLLLPAINSYLFGSIYAFSDFFSFYMGMESVSTYNVEYYNLGYYSFKSIFDLLGGSKVFPAGFYSDNYYYKDVLATNIYSSFRGFIQDFGFSGTLVFMYVFGLFYHFFFYKLLLEDKPWFASSIFVMFFGFLGFSFLINIFTSRNIFLVTFSFYILLKLNDYLNSKYLLKGIN